MEEGKQTNKKSKIPISISRDTHQWLNSKKIHSRQAFDEILQDMKYKENSNV